ncbi:hypothetical protein MIND_01193100 [Mycena indigotica]|uniref:Uncharacterized protein n=1 Tax=Mycena indigotica TaxID=2126181 RepID=A0A8H6S4V6_9AGAR|nr:uncharacterized protein MIND_01193100 [Mycena indigotica]KAF7292939.1 hypothetical protein MIND_01193100 [Mycena indigotica]
MYTYKIALLALFTVARVCAYPTTRELAPPESNDIAPNPTKVPRQLPALPRHTATNSPRGLAIAFFSPKSHENSHNVAANPAAVAPFARGVAQPDGAPELEKRQIRNADYHAASPPTNSNPPPPPAPEPPAVSPDVKKTNDSEKTDSKPAAKEYPAKDKRANVDSSLRKHAPNRVLSSNDQQEIDGAETRVAPKRRFTLASRIAREWQGLDRRSVEEMTNASNRNFDHDAVTRWSREEMGRMKRWSKLE